MNKLKLLKKVISGSDNIRFGDLVKAVKAFGFRFARKNGSHHIYSHPDMKSYQIRQFVDLLEQYSLI